MPSRFLSRLIPGVVVLLLLSGCTDNLFNQDPSADSVEAQIQDARRALTEDRPEDAVALMQTARTEYPDNVEVRTVLAQALFAEKNVDIFSVKELADYAGGFTDETESHQVAIAAASTSRAKATQLVCQTDDNPLQDPDFVPLEYRQEDVVLTFVNAFPAAEEALAAYSEVELSFQDVVNEFTGSDVPEALRSEIALVFAFVQSTIAIQEIYATAAERNSQWYRRQSTNGILQCIPLDDPTEAEVEQARRDIDDIQAASCTAANEFVNTGIAILRRLEAAGARQNDFIRDVLETIDESAGAVSENVDVCELATIE